jgi:hypothetical protein
MFESAIINKLASDTTLASYVTSHANQPAIFSEVAQETAVMPYIVIRIDRSTVDGIVQPAALFIDFYDRNKSRANSRRAVERIEFLLDDEKLTHDRYADIRLFFFAGSPVPEEDSRDIHYNIQFECRAVRSKWATETK